MGAAWFRDVFVAAVIATITIGGTFGSQARQHQIRHLDALGIALLAAISAAIFLRRRQPVACLIIVGAGVSVYFSFGYPWGPIFIPLVIAIGGAVLAGYRL